MVTRTGELLTREMESPAQKLRNSRKTLSYHPWYLQCCSGEVPALFRNTVLPCHPCKVKDPTWRSKGAKTLRQSFCDVPKCDQDNHNQTRGRHRWLLLEKQPSVLMAKRAQPLGLE